MSSLQREIDVLIKRLYAVSDKGKRESQAIFKVAAKPLIAAIKARAPVSDGPHSRYKDGSIVATYKPGNLRRSIRSLTFRRSAAVFVGPKLDKTGSGGVDGYYAAWVEFGTESQSPQPFVRPAVAETGSAVLGIAARALKKQIETHAQRLYK